MNMEKTMKKTMEMAVKGTSRQVDGPCNFCPPRYVASISSQLFVGSSAKAWASESRRVLSNTKISVTLAFIWFICTFTSLLHDVTWTSTSHPSSHLVIHLSSIIQWSINHPLLNHLQVPWTKTTSLKQYEAITHRISSMITESLGNPRYAASVSATVAGGQQVR